MMPSYFVTSMPRLACKTSVSNPADVNRCPMLCATSAVVPYFVPNATRILAIYQFATKSASQRYKTIPLRRITV